MLENIGNAITLLPIDQLGRNLGGRIQSTLLPQNCFVVIGRYSNCTVNVLVLGGVEIKNIHNFDETWMTSCHCGTIFFLNLVEKQQILIQKTLEVLSLLRRPIVQ